MVSSVPHGEAAISESFGRGLVHCRSDRFDRHELDGLGDQIAPLSSEAGVEPGLSLDLLDVECGVRPPHQMVPATRWERGSENRFDLGVRRSRLGSHPMPRTWRGPLLVALETSAGPRTFKKMRRKALPLGLRLAVA